MVTDYDSRQRVHEAFDGALTREDDSTVTLLRCRHWFLRDTSSIRIIIVIAIHCSFIVIKGVFPQQFLHFPDILCMVGMFEHWDI